MTRRSQWLTHPYFVFFLVFFLSEIAALRFSPDFTSPVSLILQFGVLLGVPLAACRIIRLPAGLALRLTPARGRDLGLSVGMGVLLSALLDQITTWQKHLDLFDTATVESRMVQLIQADSVQQWLWLLAFMVVAPAICEEALFRGYLLTRLLEPNGRWRAVLVTSAMFGIFHRSLALLMPATVGGVFLSLTIVRSRSLYNSIATHATINLMGVLSANFPKLQPQLSAVSSLAVLFLAGAASVWMMGFYGRDNLTGESS
ncbi:MAG: CPBP family intramembrane glutamic endopeptidase [Acidobacteriota bacterium]